MRAVPGFEQATGVEIVRGDVAGLDQLDVDGLAVFLFSDVRPVRGVAGHLDWRLCGELSSRIQAGLFAAAAGETMMVPTGGRFGRRRVFVFGLGPAGGADESCLRSAARHAVEVMRRAGVETLALGAPSAEQGSAIERRFALAVAAEMPDQGVRVLVEARG